MLGRMHCMLMDLLHGFEVLSTTEETLFNSRNVSRLVQNNLITSGCVNANFDNCVCAHCRHFAKSYQSIFCKKFFFCTFLCFCTFVLFYDSPSLVKIFQTLACLAVKIETLLLFGIKTGIRN